MFTFDKEMSQLLERFLPFAEYGNVFEDEVAVGWILDQLKRFMSEFQSFGMVAPTLRDSRTRVQSFSLDFRQILIASLYYDVVQNRLGLGQVALGKVGVRDTNLHGQNAWLVAQCVCDVGSLRVSTS